MRLQKILETDMKEPQKVGRLISRAKKWHITFWEVVDAGEEIVIDDSKEHQFYKNEKR